MRSAFGNGKADERSVSVEKENTSNEGDKDQKFRGKLKKSKE